MLKDFFLNVTTLITFISLFQQIFKDTEFDKKSPLVLNFIVGLYYGLLAILLMTFSININNVIIDFRYIPIILAAISQGLFASFLVSIIIALFRIFYFGFSEIAITAIIVAALLGIGCGLIAKMKTSYRKKWICCSGITLVILTIGVSTLLKDFNILMNVVLAYWACFILVSIFLYKYVTYLNEITELNKRIKKEYFKDYLTGLNNVRSFDKFYNISIKDAVEKNEQLSILAIDIDFFKKVNDTYGHQSGDLVLKELSKLLSESCRSFDIISRNGGEEFSVLLLDCPSSKALKIGERIRETVENHKFILLDGSYINVTVSIGIATFPDNTINKEILIKLADEALYKAKKTGRNKVCVIE